MKSHSLHIITAISLGIMLVSPLVLAGPKHGGSGKKFMQLFDADKDGKVTQDELAKSSAERFMKMDLDGNNTFNFEEFTQYVKSRKKERRQIKFKKMDSNSDGKIGQKEYLENKKARVTRKFDRLDINGDGTISRDEFLDAKIDRAARRFKRMDKDRDGSISPSEFVARKYRRKSGERIFKKLDGNGDGTVTRDESLKAWSNWFKRLDANNDNTVTADEIKKIRSRRRAQK